MAFRSVLAVWRLWSTCLWSARLEDSHNLGKDTSVGLSKNVFLFWMSDLTEWMSYVFVLKKGAKSKADFQSGETEWQTHYLRTSSMGWAGNVCEWHRRHGHAHKHKICSCQPWLTSTWTIVWKRSSNMAFMLHNQVTHLCIQINTLQ